MAGRPDRASGRDRTAGFICAGCSIASLPPAVSRNPTARSSPTRIDNWSGGRRAPPRRPGGSAMSRSTGSATSATRRRGCFCRTARRPRRWKLCLRRWRRAPHAVDAAAEPRGHRTAREAALPDHLHRREIVAARGAAPDRRDGPWRAPVADWRGDRHDDRRNGRARRRRWPARLSCSISATSIRAAGRCRCRSPQAAGTADAAYPRAANRGAPGGLDPRPGPPIRSAVDAA